MGATQNQDKLALKKTIDHLTANADTFVQQREFLKSLPVIDSAIGIASRAWGAHHPGLIDLWLLKGKSLTALNHYAEADSLYTLSLDVAESNFGHQSLEYVVSLGQMANLSDLSGAPDRAKQQYQECEKIWQNFDYQHNVKYAGLLTDIGSLYYRLQDWELAEHYYLQSKETWEHGLGTENLNYAMLLNNLGGLYRQLSKYKEAESTYLQSKAIRKRLLGETHSDYAQSLVNLAAVYHLTNELEKAEACFKEALVIRRAKKDNNFLQYILTVNNFAALYRAMKKYEEAEAMFKEAIEGRAKYKDKRPLDYAASVNGLGILYAETQRYREADSLMRICQAIRLKELGKNSPDYLQSVRYLMDVHARMDRFDLVDAGLSEETGIQAALLHKAARHLSESELTNYATPLERTISSYLSYFLVRKDNTNVLSGICYNNTLLYKGFLLHTSEKIRRLSFQDPAAEKLSDQLISIRAQIGVEYTQPIQKRSPELGALEAQANDLEKEMVRSVAGYHQQSRLITWKDVQQQLHPDEATIEFVQFLNVFPTVTDSVMYAALVLLPNDTAPHFIPLCEQTPLNSIFYKKSFPLNHYLNTFYASTRKDGQASAYELLWKPIDVLLKENNIKTVYYAPVGLLHKINLSAIHTPGYAGTVLADQYRLVMVESTRQVALRQDNPMPGVIRDAVIYGGIRYKMDRLAIQTANAGLTFVPASFNIEPLAYAWNQDQARSDSTAYLPGTAVEALFLDSLLKTKGITTTLHMGYSATEESMKALGANGQSPTLLHIGTHGFFSPDITDSLRQLLAQKGTLPQFNLSDNPLIRSGLKMAGSDYAWKALQPLDGMEDGILTAYEVSQLDLSKTDLVVLSACETGLGDVKGNEGVYGLQRSFRLAGAKNVLMSLWKIDDTITELLLNKFYENWLQHNMPLRNALEAAQHWLRFEKGYQEPYYWAGFVMNGTF